MSWSEDGYLLALWGWRTLYVTVEKRLDFCRLLSEFKKDEFMILKEMLGNLRILKVLCWCVGTFEEDIWHLTVLKASSMQEIQRMRLVFCIFK